VKQIFAVFTTAEAHLVRLWVDSWQARGWEPQIISAKEVGDFGSALCAAKHRGGPRAQVVPLCVLNFDLHASSGALRAVRYGKRGWLTAPLVRFPVDMTESRIAGCGRPLCLS